MARPALVVASFALALASCSSKPATGPCSRIEGPTMVLAGDFCIDATEVTNAHYQAFLDVKDGPQLGPCDWNTTYVPTAGWPGPADLPVGSVDWCDALDYCAWAGKRLCTLSEWTSACSHGGAQDYPYGATYAAQACNVPDTNAPVGVATPVASKPSCEGGYPGLFDMIGNAGEWIYDCDGANGPDDKCSYAGGGFAYASLGPDAKCSYTYRDPRSSHYDDGGIRCCADRGP
jgi:formylglycine-generating enzyme required for sulfatase activity